MPEQRKQKFTSTPFFSSGTKLQSDSKGSGLAVDSEDIGKEAQKEENYVFPKSQESGRVTSLAQPRTASCRYGGRFQVLKAIQLMNLTVLLLYSAESSLKAVWNAQVGVEGWVCNFYPRRWSLA